MERRPRSLKVCIVSSCGGHLTEVRALRGAYAHHEHFYVINDRIALPRDMEDRTLFIVHAERDWRVAINVWEAWRILRRERPTVILSMGAGPAVPFAIVGRLLGVGTVFVESVARVSTPSLTGRMLYPIARRFFYQWPALKRVFPRATCGGQLL